MASTGAALVSKWPRGAGVGMNVVHLKEVPHGNEVMVKAVPLRIGKRIQVWEKEDTTNTTTTTLSFVACFMKICILLDDLGCTLFARLSAPDYYWFFCTLNSLRNKPEEKTQLLRRLAAHVYETVYNFHDFSMQHFQWIIDDMFIVQFEEHGTISWWSRVLSQIHTAQSVVKVCEQNKNISTLLQIEDMMKSVHEARW